MHYYVSNALPTLSVELAGTSLSVCLHIYYLGLVCQYLAINVVRVLDTLLCCLLCRRIVSPVVFHVAGVESCDY